MPNEYICASCKLEFTVGWFHYHFFDSGFAAETNLVCSACGTCHTVRHAIADSQPDALLARSGPLIGGSLVFMDWVPYNPGINLRPEREKAHLGLTGISDALNLTAVQCGFCHQVGTLLDEWPEEDAVCPNCKQAALECSSSWIT